MAPVTLESQVFWAPPAAKCATLGKQMNRTQVQRPESSSQQCLLVTTSPTTDVSSDMQSSSNYAPLGRPKVLAEPMESSSVTIPTPQDLHNKQPSAPTRSSSADSPPKEEVLRGPACGSLPPSAYQPADIAAPQRSMVHEISGMSEPSGQIVSSLAEQNNEFDGCGDYCADNESRYPVDPLLEPQDSLLPQMVDGDIAMHDGCESAEQSRPCQLGNASDVCTGHSRPDGVGDENGTSEQDPQKHGGSRFAAITTRRSSSGSTAAFPATHTTPLERHRVPQRLSSPGTSHSSPEADDIGMIGAKFEEWPLQNASLKRVIVRGVATFQLQFEWPPHTGHTRQNAITRKVNRTLTKSLSSQQRRIASTKARFTPEEDDLLVKLKGEGTLPWSEIHRQFNAAFPGRSRGSLQVHYSTVLKGR
ncbi:hypothetical protein ACCO45_004460 [Purpureocillium lilacinum]|uniref:Uncharacterized protein n=1 Tax=Purpureocillium lilacinum TaxID=33203 RepID=A0ACC4E3T0_PURLI